MVLHVQWNLKTENGFKLYSIPQSVTSWQKIQWAIDLAEKPFQQLQYP